MSKDVVLEFDLDKRNGVVECPFRGGANKCNIMNYPVGSGINICPTLEDASEYQVLKTGLQPPIDCPLLSGSGVVMVVNTTQ